MRLILIYSIFSLIFSGCTVEVARETGKAIKSIENTLKLKEVKEEENKKVNIQKRVSTVNLIGKNQEQIVSLLGQPDLVRKDGLVYLMRFDRKECITFAFFNQKGSKVKVEYFELRNKNGDLLMNKSNIKKCFKDINQT